MLNNKFRSLFIFSLSLILTFSFAIAAQTTPPAKSKKTTKKTVVSQTGKKAPVLKPGVTGKSKAKTTPAAAAKTDAKAKTEPAKKSGETAAIETAKTTASASEKTVNTIKPVADAKAADAKAANAAATKTDPPKEKTYDRPALKPDTAKTVNTASKKTTSTPAAKDGPKEKTYNRAAVKPAVKNAKPTAKVTEKVTEKAAPTAAPKTEPKAVAKAEPKPTPKPAPEKDWLPPVNAQRVRSDLNGKTVADVPSEEANDGTMNWLFSNNQPKEIEILETKANGKELVVEARLFARKAKPNFDGSYDRVRGVARLYYERAPGHWELRRVDNVSLRHSDTGMDSPTPKLTSTVPTTTVASVVVDNTPPVNVVPGGSSISVAAGQYKSYSFRVADSALVTGRFQAYGGPQNDIEVYLLDNDGFLNWSNNHGAPAYYNSGRLTVGSIRTPLGAGAYYLVFSNRNSPVDDKRVEASIQLRTDQASLAGLGYSDTYNGSGVGSINTVRRVYAPSANPVPAYDPKPSARLIEPARPLNQPVNPPANRPPVSQVGGYASEQVLAETFDVQNRKFEAFPFTVKPGGMVKGTFRVIGGEERQIEAFIMTAQQYQKWTSYREAVVDYTSGRVSNGGISRILNPGDYYIVFSNYYSSRENKTIQADIHIEYLPR